MVLPSDAFAADWSLSVSALESLFLTDNLNLGEIETDAAIVSNTTLGAGLAAKGKTFDLKINPSVSIRREFFTFDEDEEQWDIFPSLALEYVKRSKRSEFNLGASVAYSSVTSSDVIEDIVTGEDVLTEENGTKLTYNLNTGLSRKLSARDTVGWSAALAVVDYSEASPSLVEYENYSTDVFWRRRLSEVVTGNASLNASLYDPGSGTTPERLTFRPLASVSAQVNKRLSGSARLGLFILESAGEPITADILFGLDATYKLNETGYTFSVSRDITPGQEGDLLDRFSARAGVNHQVNDLLSIGLSASYSVASDSDDDVTNAFQISPTLSYRLSRDWSTSLSYRFLYSDSETTAYSNAVTFNLNYNKIVMP